MTDLSAGETVSIFIPLPETCLHSALGKMGAAVGTQAFTPIQNNLGKHIDTCSVTFLISECFSDGHSSSSL